MRHISLRDYKYIWCLFQIQYLCTISQIQIENLTVTLTYIAAKELKILNKKLKSKPSRIQLKKLQKFHFFICSFCKQIEQSFNSNITISVFTVLTQLFLMTYFETTLNIRPIKRNILMDLYLVLNTLYAIVNLSRVAVICRGCDLVHYEYTETALQLGQLINSKLPIEEFSSQVQILRFRFTGCGLFRISMELVTEVGTILFQFFF